MTYYLLNINPEPWTAPSVAVGRGKGGRAYPVVYKSEALRAYQEGIASLFEGEGVEPYAAGVPLSLTFYFWRQLPDYTTDKERRARKHQADVTNLQKAAEDALQGILFDNDRDVHHVESWVMAQAHDTVGGVGIDVKPLTQAFTAHPPENPLTLGVAAPSDPMDYDPEGMF